MSELIKIAASQLGIKEISGNQDNPAILRYAAESKIAGITHDEIAWCSTFVNWCAMKAGVQMSGKPNARSWLAVGKPVSDPRPGDIVVFWRENLLSWKGHVAFYMGNSADGKQVHVLGGNQSDSVSIQSYDAAKVLGYRRLQESVVLEIPEPTLQYGDKGSEVLKLQTMLKHRGFEVGDLDGSFGQKTENALKALQANNLMKIDGIYGKKCHALLESLLQS